MIFPRRKSFSSLFYCTGVFKVTKSCESLLAEKTESCIPAISSRWWNAFLVCVSCERWKPRGESNINPRGPTCWQELDVSAHSFALRFTPIASVPVIKASVLCVVSWKIEETPLSKFFLYFPTWFFFFFHLNFHFSDYLMDKGALSVRGKQCIAVSVCALTSLLDTNTQLQQSTILGLLTSN